MQTGSLITAIVLTYGLLASQTLAARRFERRIDLVDIPPLSQSGYVVPLQGSWTCTTSQACTNVLPPPPAGKVLKYLALARGLVTFSCVSRRPSDAPIFLTQNVTLWDAAPLLPQLPDEDYLHSVIPKLREFDYTLLQNSSLICIGAIKSVQAETDVDLFGMTTFRIHTQDVVNAPTEPDVNLQWAHSTSLDLSWSIYRVETVDGMAPPTCQGQKDVIELDYAAEYWFYHA